MFKKTIIAGLAATAILAAMASSAYSYQGTGGNWGSGWESDGSGGFIGTGGNWGSGWASDGSGGLIGTGSNWGSGWSR